MRAASTHLYRFRPSPRALAAAVIAACALAVPKAHAAAPPFRVGETIQYSFFWNGVPVGKARAVVCKDTYGDALKLDLTAATNEWIDTLYRFRMHWTSSVTPEHIWPTRLIMEEAENKRKRRYIVHFDRQSKTIKSTMNRLDKDKTRNYTFTDTTAQDALSTAYAIRLRDLKPGQTFAVDAVTGRRLYRLTVRVAGQEDLTVKAGTFRALHLTAQPKRIDKPKHDDRPLLLHVWVTADVHHVPLKVSVKTPWGSVWAERTAADPTQAEAAKQR